MKAVTFTEYGGPEVLHVADVDAPRPGPGQVRIAVRAAGVNPIDWKARSGVMREVMPLQFPVVDGREAAGVVDDFARKPVGLSWEEAAALPVAVETSLRVFGLLGGVGEGQTLVVNGAAGGVGVAAVQIARARGARVIGTASEANHEFLRSLGVEPTTYGDGMVQRIRALAPDGVDLAFDTAGKGGIPDLVTLTGDPARVATIADFGAAALGVKVTGGGEGRAPGALDEAAVLVEAGRLSMPVARTFTFAEAGEAHRISFEGHVRGKLVLIPG